jgi:hypothetical protein
MDDVTAMLDPFVAKEAGNGSGQARLRRRRHIENPP